MAEGGDSSFARRHWEGYKEFWGERFSFLENYSPFIKRDKPHPSWSPADVDEFITPDPLHRPTLKTAREAAKFGAVGGLTGAVSTVGVAWKYSRSLYCLLEPVLSLAGHLDRKLPTTGCSYTGSMASQVKLMEWWQNKFEGQS